jgi:hypothetical protein
MNFVMPEELLLLCWSFNSIVLTTWDAPCSLENVANAEAEFPQQPVWWPSNIGRC